MKAGAILLALCTILLSAAPAFAHCYGGWGGGGGGYGWHGYGWNNYGWNNRWNGRWNNWNPNAYYGGWHRYWNGNPAGYGYWNPGRHIGWYTHNRPWY